MRRLTDSQLAAAEAALLGPDGVAVVETMHALAFGLPISSPSTVSLVQTLGWYENDTFTELGRCVRDPLREYWFWLQRDRRMPVSELVPELRRESFSGRRVIELGSGGGCNLLSLSGLPGRVVGIDPTAAVLQIMPILAKMAGLACPEATEAWAEDVPYGDNEFDVAVCFGAHQYMDVAAALREMGRLVDDGGEIIIVGATLGPFISDRLRYFAKHRRLGTLKYDLSAVVNTIWYQARGRRLFDGPSEKTTANPVYCTRKYLTRALAAVGFGIDETSTTDLPDGEIALFARAT